MTEATNIETPDIHATHAAVVKYVGDDGIHRRIEAVRLSDTTIGVRIDTYWDGPDAEPMHTGFRIGADAFSTLAYLLSTFALDMERFRLPSPSDDAMRARIETRDVIATYSADEATKQAVFDRVLAYFKRHGVFHGESIHQMDNPIIDAPSVLSDIADDILKFNVVEKD